LIHNTYCAGTTPALQYARQHLIRSGIPVSDTPGWRTKHLLLDVPSFRPGSVLTDSKHLDTLLSSLPRDVTIWGGNLEHPALADLHTVDLLKDEDYLWKNAGITARCALKLALPLLTGGPEDNPVLIIGWGRIGKQLALLLKDQGYPVTIAARSDKTRCLLTESDYTPADSAALTYILPQFRLIFNTAPAPVLSPKDAVLCENCIKMDLASQKGIAGDDVIWARGLPGIHAPEESGALIAGTFLRLSGEVNP